MYYQRKLDRDLGKLSVGGGGGGLINAAPPIQEKSTLPTIDRYNSRSSRWGARRPAATENYREQKKNAFRDAGIKNSLDFDPSRKSWIKHHVSRNK
jgi:hypothetical protein